MSHRQVTHLVVEMVVRIAEECGVPLAEACEGLPVSERELRRAFSGLDWDVFAQLTERLAAHVGTERLLELCARVPDISPIGQRVLGRFLSPQLMLTFICRVLAPTMYPMYQSSFAETEQPDGSVVAQLSLKLGPGFRGSKLVFDIHAVATAAVPTFIGKPPFPVRAQTSAFGGDYWFTVRPASHAAVDPLAPAPTPPP